MKTLHVFLTLIRFSFWRMIWSANTLMILLPIVGCALFVLRRGFDKIKPAENAFNSFGMFLIIVFVSFLIPICALGYGTTALGAEREERTLVFLLTRPIPRWLILFAKFLASVPLSCGLALGGFALCCRLAGPVGSQAFEDFWIPILCLTIAYLALFHLFAVTFRHPTMLALVYAIFMELFVGNLPGSIKQLAINYYGRSLLLSIGTNAGLQTPRGFEAIPAPQAYWTLTGISAGCFLLALLVFQWKEYRDVN